MSDDTNKTQPQEISNTGRGLLIGIIFGTALGVVFGVVLDNMAFMSIGIGAGLTLGIAIGASLDQRARQDESEQTDHSSE